MYHKDFEDMVDEATKQKCIGDGLFAEVYESSDDSETVVKISRNDDGYIRWAKYCCDNWQNNPHLPRIFTIYTCDEDAYTVIERLIPLSRNDGAIVNCIADVIRHSCILRNITVKDIRKAVITGRSFYIPRNLKKYVGIPITGVVARQYLVKIWRMFVALMAEDIVPFIETIKTAANLKYEAIGASYLDLHDQNVMWRTDGKGNRTLVLTDPFAS
jgi:hypothetical protein